MTGPDTWRPDAALAYLDTLRARGMGLLIVEGKLRIPKGHTPAEVELVRLLKAELVEILERDEDLRQERAAILEHEAGFSRVDAERLAGLLAKPSPERKAS
jgi:hypothetical protein